MTAAVSIFLTTIAFASLAVLCALLDGPGALTFSLMLLSSLAFLVNVALVAVDYREDHPLLTPSPPNPPPS